MRIDPEQPLPRGRRRATSLQRPVPQETPAFSLAERRRINFEQRRMSYMRERWRQRLRSVATAIND